MAFAFFIRQHQPFRQRDRPSLVGKLISDTYRVEQLLARGNFASVYLVYDENDDKVDLKAMKSIPSKDLDDLKANNRQHENDDLSWLLTLDHLNVVKYFEIVELTNENYYGLETGSVNLIMEYCEQGTLKECIEKNASILKPFSEQEIFTWITQIVHGLEHLHSILIIHRDLKPASIFLDKNDVVKIGDILSPSVRSMRRLEPDEQRYMSPELFDIVFKGSRYNYMPSTDIWSVGCILYEMVFLQPAFPTGQVSDPRVPNLGKSVFAQAMKKMLRRDPSKRADSKYLVKYLNDIGESLFGEHKDNTWKSYFMSFLPKN